MKKSADLPIHGAILKGFFQQVRFYVDQGHNVNAGDTEGRTPLILCSMVADDGWHVGLARLFLENGARISTRDKQGFNALHHACINQRPALVEVLLNALDCSALSRCRRGNTSLHFAASLGNREIIASLASLLVRYKIGLDPKNRKGLTPLHQAFTSNNVECGDLLVQFGADPEIVDPSNKSANQLRAEAIDRLTCISQLSRQPSAGKTLRKMEKEATSERPKPATVAISEAKPFDKRNDPKYVFNASAVEYFQLRGDGDAAPRRGKKSRPETAGWHDEVMGMWTLYETQSSHAYRKPAQISADAPDTSSVVGRRRTSSPTGSMSKRNSRFGVKSRAGSLTSTDGNAASRRASVVSRRNGMPPLLRTQSRASFMF